MRKDEKKKDYEVGYFDYKEFDKLLKKKKIRKKLLKKKKKKNL